MVHDTRLYDILVVSPSAAPDEIARAYKRLALKYHPDKTNHDPHLTEKFKDATRAYEILRDNHLRSVYDAYGESGLDGSYPPRPPPARHNSAPPRPLAPTAASARFPAPPFSPNNLFSQLFTDMSSAFASLPFDDMASVFDTASHPVTSRTVHPAAAEPAAARRGEDIHHTFNVLLADMYFGKVAKFQLPKMARCAPCDGTGSLDPRTCRVCKGSGRVVVTTTTQFSKFQEVGACAPCHGSGVYSPARAKCAKCDGGYFVEKKIIKVWILPGTKDGDRIILRGQLDEGRDIVPGDVVIHLHETPHPFLVRKYNDLYMERDIDLRTAMLGGAIEVRDFLRPGHHVRIFINSHGHTALNAAADPLINDGEVVGAINSGCPKIVRRLGMPINPDICDGVVYQQGEPPQWGARALDRGHLFIRFNVQVPPVTHFSPAHLELLARTLPPAAPVRAAGLTHHLSNLPHEPAPDLAHLLDLDEKRKSDDSSDEFDYDQLDVDSQGDEEHEDDQFYTQQWSKLERKKRKKNTKPDQFAFAPVGVSG